MIPDDTCVPVVSPGYQVGTAYSGITQFPVSQAWPIKSIPDQIPYIPSPYYYLYDLTLLWWAPLVGAVVVLGVKWGIPKLGVVIMTLPNPVSAGLAAGIVVIVMIDIICTQNEKSPAPEIAKINDIKDPLEQFTIYYTDLTSLTLSWMSIFVILSALFIPTMISSTSRYCTLKYLFYTLFDVVYTTVYTNINVKKQLFFPLFFNTFIFIFIANLMGLIPFSFTITSSLIVVFELATILFITINFIAIYVNRWKFGKLFLPEGVPLFIIVPLIIIELISYFARVLSLSIRLFANMMSGHALLKILSSFAWKLLNSSNFILIVNSFIPWLVVTIVLYLEIVIAVIQSYVFLTLGTIYLNDTLESH